MRWGSVTSSVDWFRDRMRISGWLEVDRYQGLDFNCVGVSSGLRVKRSVKVISHFLAVTATSDYYMSMDFFIFFFFFDYRMQFVNVCVSDISASVVT